jgi:hypothetical protein
VLRLPSRYLAAFAGIVLAATACSGKDDGAAAGSADLTASSGAGGSAIRSVAALQSALDGARASVYPELASFRIVLVPMSSATDYFRSDVSTDTALFPASGRLYQLHYNTRIFDDPPEPAAVSAILVHELKHIRDYTQMASTELIAFAIRYATQDTRDYEHQTDQYALDHRWGPALKLFRFWLYAHEDEAARAEKMRVYFTPAEIDAYLAAHPALQ